MVKTNYFAVADYTVFFCLLLCSSGIGVYYAFLRKKRKDESADTNSHLYGFKSLSIVPVTASLICGYVSGITILGTPSEIYNYGTQYIYIVFSILLMGVVIAYVYLPVFYDLPLLTIYEYLEIRFSKNVRLIVTLLFIIDELLFLPIALYVPCLAFNQATDINIYITAVVVSCVCVFYTSLGGIRGLVWVDTIQAPIILLSEIIIFFWGTVDLDGVSNVIKKNKDGGRIIFDNFRFSFLDRSSFWTVFLGGFFHWLSFNAVHQSIVAKFKTLPTIQESYMTLVCYTLLMTLFVLICSYSGLLVYAKFHDCDPMTAKLISADDQLLPLYVMVVMGNVPGITGIFISGVFGAGLSSLAMGYNATTSVILEDFIKVYLKKDFTNIQGLVVARLIIVILGIVTIGLMFVVERIGGILGAATALSAIASGTTFGLFSLGLLFPFANHYGAMTGGILGALVSSWIAFGSQYVTYTGSFIPQKLPTKVDNCVNQTILYEPAIYPDPENVFIINRIVYFWVNPIGTFTVLIVGVLVSLCTKTLVPEQVDRAYLSPVIHRFLADDYGSSAER